MNAARRLFFIALVLFATGVSTVAEGRGKPVPIAAAEPIELAFARVVPSPESTLGQVVRDPADDRRLIATVTTPPGGRTSLHWRVLGRDGRVLTDTDPEGTTGRVPRTTGRAVAMFAWTALSGFALLGVGLGRRPFAHSLIALAATGVLLEIGATMAGLHTLDLPRLLGTTGWGQATLMQIVGLAVALVRRRVWMISGSAAGLIGLAAAGHAATGTDPGLAIGISAVHGLASGAWLGGILGLALLFRRGGTLADSTAALLRMSTIALISVAVIVITGVYRAFGELGHLGALVDTGYGRVLAVKLVLVGGLLALGGVNRFIIHPRLERANLGLADTDRGALALVRRTIVVDVLLGVGVLATVALLGAFIPPR